MGTVAGHVRHLKRRAGRTNLLHPSRPPAPRGDGGQVVARGQDQVHEVRREHRLNERGAARDGLAHAGDRLPLRLHVVGRSLGAAVGRAVPGRVRASPMPTCSSPSRRPLDGFERVALAWGADAAHNQGARACPGTGTVCVDWSPGAVDLSVLAVSDQGGQFSERVGETSHRSDIGPEVVETPAEVLTRACPRSLSRLVTLQPSHRSKADLERPMVGLERIVRLGLRVDGRPPGAAHPGRGR